jgi:adenylosuccinate lyase
MTILTEFGIFEENINKELSEQLPFLATTQILMACVKAGMGREKAHEMIKKYATTNTAASFFNALSSEKSFPLSIKELNELIKNPADFAGAAITQSQYLAKQIRQAVKGKVSKVDLAPLI